MTWACTVGEAGRNSSGMDHSEGVTNPRAREHIWETGGVDWPTEGWPVYWVGATGSTQLAAKQVIN